MNRLTHRICRWFAFLSICAMFTGCLGSQAPEVTYYSLLTMAQLGDPVPVGEKAADLRLGIGPITIPDPLKRAQLVTREAGNVYHIEEFHRWAGPLEKDLTIVLGDNLGDLLGAEEIAFFPWMHPFNPTHRVAVDITRFDGNLAGEACLDARWTIADGEGTVTLASGKSTYRQAVEGGGYGALLKTESQLLAELSREIAKAIDGLQQQN